MEVTPRQCAVCKKPYDWDGNTFKVHCLECYRILAKPCCIPGCSRRIPVGSPAWKTTCSQCYLTKRSNTHGRCPTCPPERSYKLSRPLDKSQCPGCEETYLNSRQPDIAANGQEPDGMYRSYATFLQTGEMPPDITPLQFAQRSQDSRANIEQCAKKNHA